LMSKYNLYDATEGLDHSHFGVGNLSLLDRILVSVDVGEVRAFNASASISDHTPVAIEWKDELCKGMWRLNPVILENECWRKDVMCVLEEIWRDKASARNRWERVKAMLKTLGREEAKKRELVWKTKVEFLENKIKECSTSPEVSIWRGEIDKIKISKAREEVLLMDRKSNLPQELKAIYTLGRQIKASKRKESVGDKLRNEAGDLADSAKVLVSFYSKLYAKRKVMVTEQQKWCEKVKDRVPRKVAMDLSKPLTVEDLKEAVDRMKAGKSPGIDGLGVEVYRKFPKIVGWLLEAWLEGEEAGLLWDTAGEVAIRVIHKKDDVEDVKNYRPISLCNVDYKIIARAQANRLTEMLPMVIDEEQTGFVKGRDIRVNVAVMRAVIEMMVENNSDAGILLLDIEKAYDCVDRDFLWKVMESMGFGPIFIKAMKLLHQNNSARIITRWGLSGKFLVESGVRQGCPLAPLLFVVAMLPLLVSLKEEEPVKVLEEDIRSWMFADDTVIVYNSIADAVKKLKVVEEFGNVSALRMNKKKTECVAIRKPGNLVDDDKFFGPGKFTVFLGAPLGVLPNLDEYWKSKLKVSVETIGKWRKFGLSIFQKAKIANTYVASKWQYLFNYEKVPVTVLHDLDKAIKEFVFGKMMNHRPLDVQAKAKVEAGGVGLINLDLQNRATLAHWAVRMGRDRGEVWRRLVWKGYIKGNSKLFNDCKTASGSKWSSIDEGMDLKALREMLKKEEWMNEEYRKLVKLDLPPKMGEIRWRIYFQKLKIAKVDFKDNEKCIWCGSENKKLHILNECVTVRQVLAQQGWFQRLGISDKEWTTNIVNSNTNMQITKEYLMIAVKWGVWKAFASARYGNKLTPISVCVEASVKEIARWLFFKDKKDNCKLLQQICTGINL
jgi:hypothetical protein